MTRSRDVSQVTENGGVAISPAVAGKNFIINGGFDFWQRGVTFTNPGSGGNVYSADRWQAYFSQNGTVTQDTSLVLQGAVYGARVTATTSTTGATDLFQLVETLNTTLLQNKTVTFSAYVAGTSGKTPYLEITYSTTANDSLFNVSTSVVVSSTITTSGTFQKITVTTTIPSTAKTLRLGLRSNNSLGLNEYITWCNAQLELGSVATPFSRAGGTIQGELAACRYYYKRLVASSTNSISNGSLYSSTDVISVIPFEKMRVPPGVSLTNVSNIVVYSNGGASTSPSSYSASQISDSAFRLDINLSSSLTSGYSTYNSWNSNGGYIELSSEL